MTKLPQNQLTNTDVALMMKAALEYNANIVTLATFYYGNMDSKQAQKSLLKQLDAARDDYIKKLDSILGTNYG